VSTEFDRAIEWIKSHWDLKRGMVHINAFSDGSVIVHFGYPYDNELEKLDCIHNLFRGKAASVTSDSRGDKRFNVKDGRITFAWEVWPSNRQQSILGQPEEVIL